MVTLTIYGSRDVTKIGSAGAGLGGFVGVYPRFCGVQRVGMGLAYVGAAPAWCRRRNHRRYSMAYRITLVTIDENANPPRSDVRVYDVTSLEQATDYILMQDPDDLMSVNITWVGRVDFPVPM